MATHIKNRLQKKLLDAIRAKDIFLIQSAIDSGADINYSSYSLPLPLLIAVKTQDLSIVIKIAELGGLLNFNNTYGSVFDKDKQMYKKLFLNPNLDIIIFLKGEKKHFPNNISLQIFNYALRNSYLDIARYIFNTTFGFFNQLKNSKRNTKKIKIENKLSAQQSLQNNQPLQVSYIYNNQYSIPSYSHLSKDSQEFLKHSKYIEKSFHLLIKYINSFSNKKNQQLFFKLYDSIRTDLSDFFINFLFSKACANGNMELVLFFIHNKDPIDFHWKNETHLVNSIISKNLDLFKFLIEKNCNIYHKVSSNSYVESAQWMVYVYNPSFLTYLFENGFDMLRIRENLKDDKKLWLDRFLHQQHLDAQLPQAKYLSNKTNKL